MSEVTHGPRESTPIGPLSRPPSASMVRTHWRRLRAQLPLIGPWALGVLLLTWRLDRSVMAGDELHLVRALDESGPLALMTAYRLQDHCLPLAGLFATLLSLGIPLGTLLWRLPGVLSYAVLLMGGAVWLDRRLGRRRAVAYSWLVAVSPLALLYGRILRPYVMLMVLVPTSLLFFLAWWRERHRRHLFVHALCGAVGAYFHPIVVPMVLSPWLFAAIAAWRRRSLAPLRAGFLATGATALGILLFLVPAWSSLRLLVAAKKTDDWPDLTAQSQAYATLLGSPSWPLALLLLGLALLGWRALRREEPDLASVLVISTAAQIAGLWILRPFGFAVPIQHARYLIGILPALVVCVASGWVDLTRRWPRFVRVPVGVLGIGGLLLSGPLLREPFLGGTFAHHKDVVGFYSPPARLHGELPDGYRWLASRTDHETVIEVPAPTSWRRNRPLYVYQEHHRRGVILGVSPAPHRSPLVRLPGVLRDDAIEELRKAGRYLVLHHDLGSEDSSVIRESRSPASAIEARSWEDAYMRKRATELEELYRRRLGPPAYSGTQVSVWDLSDPK